MATFRKQSVQGQASRPASHAPVAIVVTLLSAAAAGAAMMLMITAPAGRLDPSGTLSPLISGWLVRGLTIVGSMAVLALAGFFQWRTCQRPAPQPSALKRAAAPIVDVKSRASTAIREQRLFVHLLSRLQRDGRLMDFLAEDLEAYTDAQIGAAARSVHLGCRKVVEKLLAPRPVLPQAEETRLSLGADYDPTTITLTGQVADKPPFEGVVRHTGWRATRIQVPLLSEEADPAIIAPAEVEVG